MASSKSIIIAEVQSSAAIEREVRLTVDLIGTMEVAIDRHKIMPIRTLAGIVKDTEEQCRQLTNEGRQGIT